MMEVQNLRRNLVEFFVGKASHGVELDQLVQALADPVFWECAFDYDVASGAKTTEENFGW